MKPVKEKLYHHFVATTSKDFDTTLMICILRNLSLIPPPSSGWDTLPLEFENRLGANLTIIKVYRNKLCHASQPRINDNTFRKMKSSLIHVRFTLLCFVFQMHKIIANFKQFKIQLG